MIMQLVCHSVWVHTIINKYNLCNSDTFLMCLDDPLFEMEFKSGEGGVFPYCRWYAIPDFIHLD